MHIWDERIDARECTGGDERIAARAECTGDDERVGACAGGMHRRR